MLTYLATHLFEKSLRQRFGFRVDEVLDSLMNTVISNLRKLILRTRKIRESVHEFRASGGVLAVF